MATRCGASQHIGLDSRGVLASESGRRALRMRDIKEVLISSGGRHHHCEGSYWDRKYACFCIGRGWNGGSHAFRRPGTGRQQG